MEAIYCGHRATQKSLFESDIDSLSLAIVEAINALPLSKKVESLNKVRKILHEECSPFKNEPVDFVEWVQCDSVKANEYNPNKVAPPEMELLEISIINDGYTQPIVTWPTDGKHEVVDGFHRSRVGKESKQVSARLSGYLPAVSIRNEQSDKNNRVASKFIAGWKDRGYTTIPDEAPHDLEVKCWAPSWKRMCRVLLRNDHWCKGLGQTQPKSDAYQQFKEIKAKRKRDAAETQEVAKCNSN